MTDFEDRAVWLIVTAFALVVLLVAASRIGAWV